MKNSKYKINDIYICECGKEYNKSQSLNAHFSHCLIHRNGIPAKYSHKGTNNWEKLSREERVINGKKTGLILSEKIKSGVITPYWKGKHHSEETKRKLSEKRSEFLANNPSHKVHFFEVSNGKRNIKVQGNWELKVAEWLNKQAIGWDRKKIKFGHRTYTPDFVIDVNTIIEVKGYMRERDLYKLRLFKSFHPNIKILLIEKNEFFNIDELKFSDLLTLEQKYDLSNINESIFRSYK